MREGQPQSPPHQVTLFWAAVWLIAVMVMSILASVAFYQQDVVQAQLQSRLLGIIIIGEVLLYFIVLLVPGEQVVPPGRTLLAVILAMATRAGLAALSAEIVILRYVQDGSLAKIWLELYSSFWPAAVVQILLLGLYLWLIRSALEIPPHPREHPSRKVTGRDFDEQLEEFRIPTPPDDKKTRERQEELLSALMEQPDAPAQWPEADREEIADELAPDVGATSETDQEPEAPVPSATPQEPVEDESGESTDAMPPVPAFLADEQPERQPAPEAPLEPEGEAAEEERAKDLVPPTPAEEASEEPEEAPAEIEAPTPPEQQRMLIEEEEAEEKEEEEEEEQPVEAAPTTADVTSEQARMIEEALTDLPDRPVHITLSPSERIHALVDLVGAQTEERALAGALDRVHAGHVAAATALHAGDPVSVSLLAAEGALIAAPSPNGGTQVVVYVAEKQPMGKLSLLARNVVKAATAMPVDEEYHPEPPQVQCQPDDDRTQELQQLLDDTNLRAYTAGERTVVIAGPAPDADGLACAVAELHEAAAEVAAMLPGGLMDRLLAEGVNGGIVAAVADDGRTLVVAVAETASKMGAANVQARKIRTTIEEK